MKRLMPLLWVALATTPAVQAAPPTELCTALQRFTDSVPSGEKKSVTFRTSWGSNFNDDPAPVLFAKRCAHGGDPVGQRLCGQLLAHGSAEFTEYTVKQAINCLSMAFLPNDLEIEEGAFSFRTGAPPDSASVHITFKKDAVIGGRAFWLEVARD